ESFNVRKKQRKKSRGYEYYFGIKTPFEFALIGTRMHQYDCRPAVLPPHKSTHGEVECHPPLLMHYHDQTKTEIAEQQPQGLAGHHVQGLTLEYEMCSN
ncbi:hypothetical protein NECAME_08798, partial [Necator americanus]